MKKIVIFVALAFLCPLVPGLVLAQQEAAQETRHPAEAQAKAKSQGEQVSNAQQTAKKLISTNEQMRKRVKQMNSSLDKKLSTMNAAEGEQKEIEAIKAAINQMASQRKELMNMIMSMQGEMNKMMGKMSEGGMSSMMGGTE